MAINSTDTLSFRPMSDVAYHSSGRRSSRRGGGRRDFVAGDIVEVTKPFGRTVKLLRKVKNLRSGSTMNRWLVSFGHGLGSGAFDRRELPDMEMDEDCFRKLVSSEVFAPKSAQMRRSHSDEQKPSTATTVAAATEKSSLGKAVEDSLTQEVKVEEEAIAAAAEPAAETDAVSAPPQKQNLKLSDDSAESSPRIDNAIDSNGASHKRKVSHESSTSSPLNGSDQQPPTKKLCPAFKSEEPPTISDTMDEEKMDASTSERDEQQLQTQPLAEEPAPTPPAPSPPIKEDVEEAKAEVETKVEVEEPVKMVRETVVEELTMAEPRVEEVETKVEMDVDRTPDLKSVNSDEAKETEDNSNEEEQQAPIPVTEEVSSPPSPPPVKEELPVNAAMEEKEEDVAMEESAPAETEVDAEAEAEAEAAPQTAQTEPKPETVDSDAAKQGEEDAVPTKRKRSSSDELTSSPNKISEEEQPMQSTTDAAPKSPTPPSSPKASTPLPSPPKSPSPPPQPRAPTPPPMLLAHDLLAKAKLAKKLSQKPISLQQLKQQARAKLNERAMHQGKGGKKQKRKGERKSRRYQKVPPPKPQTSEAEASTNSSEEAEENVEKIVMNTGTLYLYRGENPRAEFIRRK